VFFNLTADLFDGVVDGDEEVMGDILAMEFDPVSMKGEFGGLPVIFHQEDDVGGDRGGQQTFQSPDPLLHVFFHRFEELNVSSGDGHLHVALPSGASPQPCPAPRGLGALSRLTPGGGALTSDDGGPGRKFQRDPFSPAGRWNSQFFAVFGHGPPRDLDVPFVQQIDDPLIGQGVLGVLIVDQPADLVFHRDRRSALPEPRFQLTVKKELQLVNALGRVHVLAGCDTADGGFVHADV